MNGNGRVIPIGHEPPAMDPVRKRRNGDSEASERKAAPLKRVADDRGRVVRQRFALLNAVVDYALPGMRRSELAAWLVLYRHAKPDGTVVASVADLARRSGCSDRAMRTALPRMQSAGLLARLKRGTLAGGPSVWRLRTPEPPTVERKPASGHKRK